MNRPYKTNLAAATQLLRKSWQQNNNKKDTHLDAELED